MSSFAGVSLIGDDGKPAASRPAWDTTADSSDSGYHLFVVRGYSRTKHTVPNGKCIDSQQFRVGGYRWLIEYYPNGREDDDIDNISFCLLLDEDRHDVENVIMQFEFSFIDQVEKQEASRIRASLSCDVSGGDCWGYPWFIRRSVLERSRHLKDDSFTVRCDIIIAAMNPNTTERRRSSSLVVSPPPGIQQHLSSLLLSGEGTDVTFQVGGETIMAHRSMLAARSPVFRAELFGPMKEGTTTSVIRIEDMEPQVFRLLLSFIYSDSVPAIGDYDEDGYGDDEISILWQHLLVAADIYDLQKLKMICEENLYKYIEATTVASILALAEQHNSQGLKDACLNFRKEEIKSSSGRFRLLGLDTFK